MQTFCLEALRIPIADGISLRLEDEARPPGKDFSVPLPQGRTAVASERTLEADRPNDRPPFFYDPGAPERGLHDLRIFELRDYAWELEFEGKPVEVKISSSLASSGDSDLWHARDTHGRFRFVNYLGAAWMVVSVPGRAPVRILFEVASPKLDYESEYRSLVEAIGKECQQLLLEWGTPTTLNISPDPAKRAQTLLEQFLFLRHVLGPDRLELYLEIIQRQPHSRLETERNWKPAGAANPVLFIRDPLRHGRDWSRDGNRIIPSEIRDERKFDSFDTPPNRFLKFALEDFRNLCDEVIKTQKADSAVALEAIGLQHSLDAFLARPLFDDVGQLQRIPFESTTLQRREGYREILQAWLMLDAAAQIDWPGLGEAYKGTSRNVATLYEYWLFFVLVRAFRNELKMEPEKDPLAPVDGAVPFCCKAEDGRLIINLKQGDASFCRYSWSHDGQKLAVHFFYNRSFGRKNIGERGSYSKTFRPDYTLVIIPEGLDDQNRHVDEVAAEKTGRIAYLHFDAKYRGENLPGIFGTAENEEDEPEDKRTKAAGTVKNADLYKMHTYNEAIRRTVGSYVLYPGIAPEPETANACFQRYHEIIPGIGAFALRPGAGGLPPAGLPLLMTFIRDLLTHHLTKFSQSYRIDYWTQSTIREEPVAYAVDVTSLRFGDRPPIDTEILLGFVRGAAAALDCRNKSAFFCHAVAWKAGVARNADGSGEAGEAVDLRFNLFRPESIFDPFRTDFLVVFYANQTADWFAQVKEVKLVTAAERADEIERPLTDMNAAYYYRFELKNIQALTPRNLREHTDRRPGKPIACRLSDFAKYPIA